jgi:hypothetical protein
MTHPAPRDIERHAASWVFTLGLVFALAVIVSTGCAVPGKVLDQLAIDTAAADRVTELWSWLSDEDRATAYQKMRQGAWVLRYALDGVLPEDEALKAVILEWAAE